VLFCMCMAYFKVHGSGEDGLGVAIFELVLMLAIFLMHYIRDKWVFAGLGFLVFVPAGWLCVGFIPALLSAI